VEAELHLQISGSAFQAIWGDFEHSRIATHRAHSHVFNDGLQSPGKERASHLAEPINGSHGLFHNHCGAPSSLNRCGTADSPPALIRVSVRGQYSVLRSIPVFVEELRREEDGNAIFEMNNHSG
jgi:hypothetical protein